MTSACVEAAHLPSRPGRVPRAEAVFVGSAAAAAVQGCDLPMDKGGPGSVTRGNRDFVMTWMIPKMTFGNYPSAQGSFRMGGRRILKELVFF